MRLTPSLHASLSRLAESLKARDEAALAACLAIPELAAEPDEIVPALVRWFPDLALAAPADLSWPQSLSQRLLVLVRDEIACPFASEGWLERGDPPQGWNWLTGLAETMAETPQSRQTLIELRRRGEGADPQARLHHALAAGPPSTRVWCWLGACSLTTQDTSDASAQVIERLLTIIEESPRSVPAWVHVAVLSRLAAAGRGPDRELQRAVKGLTRGLLLDIALAAVLIGYANAAALSADLVERIVPLPATRDVVLLHDRDAKRWHQLMLAVLKAAGHAAPAPLGARSLAGIGSQPPHGAGPAHADLADGLMAIARALDVTRRGPAVTLAAIQALLIRLRRDDLAAAIPDARPLLARDPRLAGLVQAVLPRADRRALRADRDGAQGDGEGDPDSVAAEPAVAPLSEPAAPAVAGQRIDSASVSICILSYNGSAATCRLVAGLARLWPDFAGEILVLDNASAAEDFAMLSHGLAPYFPGRIRLFQAPRNLGVGPARNLLFEAAHTPWILSLDNDMVPIVDLGAELMMLAEATVAFFNLAYEEVDRPGMAGYGKSWAIETDDAGRKRYVTRYVAHGPRDGPPGHGRHLVEGNRLSGGSSLISREVFNALGGYSADHEVGFDDYELSFRLKEQGYRVLTPPRAMLVHGHLAPRNMIELGAILARFDPARFGQSRSAFGATLASRFAAVDLRRREDRAFAILPRRLDLRYARGAQFFVPPYPGLPSLAVIAGEGVSAEDTLAPWPAGSANVALFHEREFPEPEQALLLLQTFASIVGPARFFRSMTAESCHELGLVWREGMPAPLLLGIGETTMPVRRPLYPNGPDLVTVASLSEARGVMTAGQPGDGGTN